MWCLERIRAPRAFSWAVLGRGGEGLVWAYGKNGEGGEEGDVLNVFHLIFTDVVA